jgi:hypothetical protein
VHAHPYLHSRPQWRASYLPAPVDLDRCPLTTVLNAGEATYAQ